MRDGFLAAKPVGDILPQDAELVNVRHAWPNTVELLISSESFEEVADGKEIPIFYPRFEAIR